MNNTNKTPQELAEEKRAQEAIKAKTEDQTGKESTTEEKPPVAEPKTD